MTKTLGAIKGSTLQVLIVNLSLDTRNQALGQKSNQTSFKNPSCVIQTPVLFLSLKSAVGAAFFIENRSRFEARSAQIGAQNSEIHSLDRCSDFFLEMS